MRTAVAAVILGMGMVYSTTPSAVAECPRYEVAATLPGAEGFSNTPTDLSEAGYVAGYLNDLVGSANRPYVWWGDGPLEFIPLENLTRAQATGVNDDRIVVGWFEPAGGTLSATAFIYDGVTKEIEYVPPPKGMTARSFLGINESGRIFGQLVGSDPIASGLFVRDGTLERYHPWNEDQSPIGRAIGSQGDVVGRITINGAQLGFVWRVASDETELIAIPQSGPLSLASGVNGLGHVVGVIHLSSGPFMGNAYLWRGGVVEDLGRVLDYRVSTAADVNDSDQVVGTLSGSATRPGGGFLWENGRMHSLQDLVHGSNKRPVERAVAINDHGIIVARGPHNSASVLRRIEAVTGDATCDQVVGFDDLLEVLSNWGDGCTVGTSSCHMDFDRSGDVDSLDLLVVLENWDE